MSITYPNLWHGIKTTVLKVPMEKDNKGNIVEGKSIYDQIEEIMRPMVEVTNKERDIRKTALEAHYILGEVKSKLDINEHLQ